MTQRRNSDKKVTLSDGLKAGFVRVSDRYGEHIRATAVGKEFQKSRIWVGDPEIDLNLRPTFGSRITLVGNQHQGKTLTLYRLISATQRTCRQCFTPILQFIDDRNKKAITTCRCGANDPSTVTFFDQEVEFDPQWARVHGVRVDETVGDYEEIMEGLRVSPDAKFAICRVQSAEQASTVIEALVEIGACDLIALDSIAMLNPQERLDGKKQPGDQARAISRMVTSLISAQAANWIREGVAPTFIATNQYRVNIAMMNPKADPRKAAGGNAYQYGNMQEWQLYSKYNAGESDRTMAHTYADMQYTIKKDKQGSNTNSIATARLFLRDFSKNRLSYKAGETNAPEKLFDLIKDIGSELNDTRWYEKRASSMTVLGRKFTTVQAIKEFLRRPDIAYMVGACIASNVLDNAARAHMRLEDYMYCPFEDEPLLEILSEAKERLGEFAAKNVGARSWMDQLPEQEGDGGGSSNGGGESTDPFTESEEPETGSEA